MAINDDDEKKVNVNLIDDVDAFTLTAVGFGLIAFNFLVLANVSSPPSKNPKNLLSVICRQSHHFANYICRTRWEMLV
jgi:hypothetical protein